MPKQKTLEELQVEVQALLRSNQEEAVALGKYYLAEAKNKEATEHISSAYNFIGTALFYLRRFEEALNANKMALRLYKEQSNTTGLRATLNTIGAIFRNTGNYDLALKSYFEALTIDADNVKSEANTYNNIAIIYQNQGDLTKGLEYFNKAANLLENETTRENLLNLGLTLNNIGKIHIINENINEALQCFTKAKDIGEKFNDKLLLTRVYNSLGMSHYTKSENELSIKYLNKALKLAKENSLNTEVLRISLQIILPLKSLNKYDKIEEILFDSIKIAEEEHSDYIIPCFEKLVQFYSEVDDFERAFNYLQKLSQLREKEKEKAKEKEISKLQIEFETFEKEKQNELLKQQLQFQEEVKLRNKLLLEKNQDLEQFSRAVSHDLKEPVRQMKAFSKILSETLGDRINDREMEMFLFIKNSSDRMSNMIDDLLRFARLSSDDGLREPVDLNKVLNIVTGNLQLLIQENEVEVKIDSELPIIQASESQMIQLLQNFISNAIKFRRKDIIPKVELKNSSTQKDYILKIIDNGMGIPKEDIKNIFRVFKRSSNTEEIEGSGIGLSVCQKIINRLDGEISVESKVNAGTTFTIRIPK